MSHQTGIRCNQKLKDFFAQSKDGHIRMIKVVIVNEEICLDSYKESKSNWENDFNDCILNSIDSKKPCYIFYRLDEKIQSTFKWLFIAWSPDFAEVKQKMLYAATKSTLKLEFFAGQVVDDIFGTVRDDVSLEGYLKHIKSQQAPAPLTNREEELEILRQSENHSIINVDTKHKTLQGVMFPIEQYALSKLDLFQANRCDYIQLSIDVQNEKILLVKSLEKLDPESIDENIPQNNGRFHLYRFNHEFEGEHFNSVIFIYSMPGFSCSVKERMLYSSCKSELIGFIKNEMKIDLSKTFEVSEPGELTRKYLLDELHPKKASDALKFEKPKGPSSRGPRRVTKQSGQGNDSGF